MPPAAEHPWRPADEGTWRMRPLLSAIVALLPALVSAQQTVSIPVPGQTAALQADLYGRGDRAVVLAHGGRFDKASWSEQARTIAKAGFLVLAIQYTGDSHNLDGSSSSTGSAKENAADVLAAVAYCHRVGAKTVSAIGSSLGGDAVADADAQSRPGEIDRIVLLASSAGETPERLLGRKLFIVARNDRSASGPRLPGIEAAFARAPQPKQLLLLDGSAHAQSLFSTPAGPSLMRTILHFLSTP